MTKYDTLTTYNEIVGAQDRRTRKVILTWTMTVITAGIIAYSVLGCSVMPAWALFCTTQCIGTFCTTYCT